MGAKLGRRFGKRWICAQRCLPKKSVKILRLNFKIYLWSICRGWRHCVSPHALAKKVTTIEKRIKPKNVPFAIRVSKTACLLFVPIFALKGYVIRGFCFTIWAQYLTRRKFLTKKIFIRGCLTLSKTRLTLSLKLRRVNREFLNQS